MKGGASISGNPAFDVDNATGAVTIRGNTDHRGTTAFTGTADFNNLTNFNDSVEFNDIVDFHDDVEFDQLTVFKDGGAGAGATINGTAVTSQPCFAVSPAVAFTDKPIPWRILGGDPTNPALFKEEYILVGGQQATAPSTGADGILKLDLSPNCIYSGFSILADGSAHGGAFPPTNRTTFQVKVNDIIARTTNNISNADIDSSIQATYESTHTVTLTGITPFRPDPTKHYVLVIKGENGTNAIAGYVVYAVKATGTIDRVGKSASIPAL